MTRIDREALTLALKQARRLEYARREQLDAMLKDRPWFEVASFVAYCCQCANLRLTPWETPPCDCEPDHGDDAALQLLSEMMALGTSRYHPDPVAAIEAKKAIISHE